ncbi:MAG: type 1 periplasmic binding fold superfamily protein [Thalassobius sp.]|nr:type 1 periplasmic binding fold superfamily protein [Thalassovita sp.]|tara:strand:- start:159 stop:731 length:573 start_codon:yes stop_codon:yes gene_type:complete
MTKKLNLKLLALLFALFAFTACDDDDDIIPEEENEEEVITTVKLTFTDESDVETVFTWADPENDGSPVIDDITLESGKTYELSVQLLNETESPAEDITEEVEEEGVDHQFFFSGTAIDDLITISYNDSDEDGNPVGLDNNVTILATGGPSVLTVILRHQPDKSATGVSDGEIDNAGGETDVSVDFNITVQ